MRWQWQWKLGNLRFDVIHQLGCLKAFNIPVGLRSRFFWFPEKWLKWFDCALRNRQSMCLCDTDWWFQIYLPAPSAAGWLAALMPPCSSPKMTASLRSSALITADGRLIRAGGGKSGDVCDLSNSAAAYTKLFLLAKMFRTMAETCFKQRENVTSTNRNEWFHK